MDEAGGSMVGMTHPSFCSLDLPRYKDSAKACTDKFLRTASICWSCMDLLKSAIGIEFIIKTSDTQHNFNGIELECL